MELAVFLRVPTKPRPRTAASTERVHLNLSSLVEATGWFAALASHDKIRQISARAAFIEP
jgi:hypothetical protein